MLIRPDVIWKNLSCPLYHVHFTVIHTNSRHKKVFQFLSPLSFLHTGARWPAVTSSVAMPGPWFNIKMLSYQYRKSHCGDKTVVRSSYLHNGISHTGKMVSLYWIRTLGYIFVTLQWRQNDQQIDGLFNSLFWLTKENIKTHETHYWPFMRGIPELVDYHHKKASNVERVSISWRHSSWENSVLLEKSWLINFVISKVHSFWPLVLGEEDLFS